MAKRNGIIVKSYAVLHGKTMSLDELPDVVPRKTIRETMRIIKKDESISFRTDNRTREALIKLALKYNLTVSSTIQMCLHSWLFRDDKKEDNSDIGQKSKMQ